MKELSLLVYIAAMWYAKNEPVSFNGKVFQLVLFALGSVFSIWYFAQGLATLLLINLAGAILAGDLTVDSDIFLTVVFSSFAIGFLCDAALNLYFRDSRAETGRGKQLRAYFDKSGMLSAAMFAGAVTVIMTILTLMVSDLFDLRLPTLDTTSSTFRLNDGALVCLVGLFVGALIGIPAQNSRAMEDLLPFYNSTSGLLENRAWDGGSQAFAMVLVQLALSPIMIKYDPFGDLI
jgi:hypothetical protein